MSAVSVSSTSGVPLMAGRPTGAEFCSSGAEAVASTEAAPLPWLLEAVTRTVYAVPAVREVMA